MPAPRRAARERQRTANAVSQPRRAARAEKAPTPVPAAARTMALFEIFAREKRELSNSEIARFMDLPESSCSNILAKLQSLGYVSRTASTRRFYPTRRLLTLAEQIAMLDPFATFGGEAVRLLSELSGESATFGVLEGDSIRILAVQQGRHRLRYVVSPGSRAAVHATALGKALLGGLSDSECGSLLGNTPLRRLTPTTKVSPADLLEEVRAHRALGWYGAREEGALQLSALAASGFIDGELVAMSIIGPTDRFDANHDKYVRVLAAVVARVFEQDA